MPEPDNSLPIGPVIVIIVILFLLAVGLLTWALLNHNLLNTHNLMANQSPSCLSVPCPNNTSKVNYQLDPSANPNTADYQTVNFCTVNAPPTSFVQALQVCGGITSPDQTLTPPITATQVTSFANFYNNNYINTCGYNWKLPPSNQVTVPQADPTLPALIACASKLGVSQDPNVLALKTICGSTCS